MGRMKPATTVIKWRGHSSELEPSSSFIGPRCTPTAKHGRRSIPAELGVRKTAGTSGSSVHIGAALAEPVQDLGIASWKRRLKPVGLKRRGTLDHSIHQLGSCAARQVSRLNVHRRTDRVGICAGFQISGGDSPARVVNRDVLVPVGIAHDNLHASG
jgi:hypothetical protein